ESRAGRIFPTRGVGGSRSCVTRREAAVRPHAGTRRLCAALRNRHSSVTDLPAAHDGAKQLKALAVEPLHLQLLDWRKVVRPRVYLDARQEHVEFKILETRGLLHDVLAGQIVAALLQHPNLLLPHPITHPPQA